MRDTDLYRQLQALEKPWTVDRVELDVKKLRVDVFAKHEKPKSWTCPECNKPFGFTTTTKSASGVTSIAAASRRSCMLGFRA